MTNNENQNNEKGILNAEISEEIKKIVEENPMALATIDNEGNPYCIVIACVKIKDNKIVITNNYMNKTLKNIQDNNKVCLVVWDNNMNGYQFVGEAEYFEEGKWLDFVKAIEENKDEPCKGAIVIEINEIKKCG